MASPHSKKVSGSNPGQTEELEMVRWWMDGWIDSDQ